MAIRKNNLDPAAQVAQVAAWIAAHPNTGGAPQKQGVPSPPLVVPSSRVLTGEAALRQNVVSQLRATRVAAVDPEQQVKAVAEFRDLHAAPLSNKVPANPETIKRVMSGRLAARLAAKPGDLNAQMAEALLEIRAQTDPQEQVRLTAELLRLNQGLIHPPVTPTPLASQGK